MKEWQMKNAINSRLPRDVYIKSIEIVDESFHSRYNAKSKTYRYVIDLNEFNPFNKNYCYYYKYKLDVNKIIEASKILIGEHDYKSFTKNHTIENTIRTIYDIKFDIENNVINIEFYGNGFLHNMIRIIVAMLIEVGNDRLSKEDLQNIMDMKNRKLAPKLAPANGLYLVSVEY
jgi:tRNA pseudouridine38-40 synthase